MLLTSLTVLTYNIASIGGWILIEILLRKKQFKRSADLLAFVHKS
jgi:hypothetical protein